MVDADPVCTVPFVTDDLVTGVEAAILGAMRKQDVEPWLDEVLRRCVGTELAHVVFRSGRIDAVYGVATVDGRELVIKVHRPPVDVDARSNVVAAQRILVEAGFPCARPLGGPATIDGPVVTVETLLTGGRPGDGHDAEIRRSVAAGLSQQIDLLRQHPDLVTNAGAPPAWYQYQDGPWPTPHDSIFDFSATPDGYQWLDDFARDVATILTTSPRGDDVVVGHADWYCGNLRFADTTVVATFDWDLVADTTAMVAGFTAGAYTMGEAPGAGPPSPDEVTAFVADVEQAQGRPFDAGERRLAVAAACWNLAYSARCDLAMLDGRPQPGSALDLLDRNRQEYLDLRW